MKNTEDITYSLNGIKNALWLIVIILWLIVIILWLILIFSFTDSPDCNCNHSNKQNMTIDSNINSKNITLPKSQN